MRLNQYTFGFIISLLRVYKSRPIVDSEYTQSKPTGDTESKPQTKVEPLKQTLHV